MDVSFQNMPELIKVMKTVPIKHGGFDLVAEWGFKFKGGLWVWNCYSKQAMGFFNHRDVTDLYLCVSCSHHLYIRQRYPHDPCVNTIWWV